LIDSHKPTCAAAGNVLTSCFQEVFAEDPTNPAIFLAVELEQGCVGFALNFVFIKAQGFDLGPVLTIGPADAKITFRLKLVPLDRNITWWKQAQEDKKARDPKSTDTLLQRCLRILRFQLERGSDNTNFTFTSICDGLSTSRISSHR
jgi:hypothetical protein